MVAKAEMSYAPTPAEAGGYKLLIRTEDFVTPDFSRGVDV